MQKQLVIYNTLTRKKENFKPLRQEVGMYCCGPTVYNFAHIGNLRTYIFEDVLKRTLQSLGYTVKHVVNITDVGHLTSDADTGEDKMEKGAQREGKTVWEIAEFYTRKFMENIKDLNILDADIWPKATEHIAEMIELVRKLEENGVTYRTDDGIYFDTTKFPAYCDFAGLDPKTLRAGSRVDMGDKRHPTDFALWKFSPKDVQRQMEWDSPWGTGFPGWHIECSAMSLKYLPQPIDIHCGGTDHVRIHHTNEVAQVEAATHTQFVRYWIHGEWLVVEKGKMSKSKDNFITLDTLKEEKVAPLAYRLYSYSAHYRSPLKFSWEGIRGAANSLENLRKRAAEETAEDNGAVSPARIDTILIPFWNAVYDDLNMPQALAAVWDIVQSKEFTPREKKVALEQADTILALDLFSGEERKVVVHTDVRVISSEEVAPELTEKIVSLAATRREARKEKDYAVADRMRDELGALGVTVNDLPDGTTECIVTR